MMDGLSEIPLPSQPVEHQPAWKSAQDALHRMGYNNTPQKKPPMPPSLMQQYPWMAAALGTVSPVASNNAPTPPNPYTVSPYGQRPVPNQQQPPRNNAWNPQPQQRFQGPPMNNGPNNMYQTMPHTYGQPPGQRPVKFAIKPLNSSFVSSNPRPMVVPGTAVPVGGGPFAGAPPSVMNYIQRARMAIEDKDAPRLTEYLEKRLRPLLSSGTAGIINWDNEPLPHTLNFQVKTMWTPAHQLPGKYNSQKARRSDEMSTPEKKLSKKERKRREHDQAAATATDYSNKAKKAKKSVEQHLGKQNEHQKVYSQMQLQAQKQQQKKDRWQVDVNTDKLNARGARFASKSQENTTKPSFTLSFNPTVRTRQPVIHGTCQTIPKAFFRLTAAPDPSLVRPLPVLRKALEFVKEKYRSGTEYSFVSSQLRSIRQDLTVQRIRNAFTVLVYETHARICLENKDREEFNQCQNQLKSLYADVEEGCPHRNEFTAYRLLYFIYMNNGTDVMNLLRDVTDEMREDECMEYALKVREAVGRKNYPKLLKLAEHAPRMCGYLMDMFIDRERKAFLDVLGASHCAMPISATVLCRWFSMGKQELVEWLAPHGFTPDAKGNVSFKPAKN